MGHPASDIRHDSAPLGEPIGLERSELSERFEQRERDAVYVDLCVEQGGFPTLVIAYAPQRPNRRLRPAYV